MSSSWVIFSWHFISWLCIFFLVLPKILNPLYAVALCTEWGNLHLHYFWCNWDDTWPFINSYLSSILQFERKQNLEIIVNACTTTTKQGQGRIYTSVSGLTHILHLHLIIFFCTIVQITFWFVYWCLMLPGNCTVAQ